MQASISVVILWAVFKYNMRALTCLKHTCPSARASHLDITRIILQLTQMYSMLASTHPSTSEHAGVVLFVLCVPETEKQDVVCRSGSTTRWVSLSRPTLLNFFSIVIGQMIYYPVSSDCCTPANTGLYECTCSSKLSSKSPETKACHCYHDIFCNETPTGRNSRSNPLPHRLLPSSFNLSLHHLFIIWHPGHKQFPYLFLWDTWAVERGIMSKCCLLNTVESLTP